MHNEFSEVFNTELITVINYIDSKNTNEAGLRWFIKFEEFLNEKLNDPQAYSECKNSSFKELGLKC